MRETKFYIVETDNDDFTPADMADEFLAHDGERLAKIVLAGTGEREMEVTELGLPEEHFYGDDDEPWLDN
jgi:hypothetical protein